MKRWRSLTHGMCLLGGKHADPRLRAECPALRQKRAGGAARHAEPPSSRTPGANVGRRAEAARSRA